MKKAYSPPPIRCLLCLLLLTSAFCYAQTFKWAYQVKGDYTGNMGLLSVDNQNNFYLPGEYIGTIQPGEAQLQSTYSTNFDQFLFKYDQNRNALWYKIPKGFRNGNGMGTIADKDGNVYELRGLTEGVFDNLLTQPSGTNAYLTKYSPTGQRLWIKFFSGCFIYPSVLNFDDLGNLFLTVNVEDEFKYDNKLVSNEKDSSLFVKLNQDGTIIWTAAKEPYADLAIDPAGNLFSSGRMNIPFIKKYSNNGELLWSKTMKGEAFLYTRQVVVDLDGNSYLSGVYCGTISVDHLQLSNSCGSQDGNTFIAKFDSKGNALWLKDYGNFYNAGRNRIIPNKDGGIYLSGINETNTVIQNMPLQPGIFIGKITHDGSFIWLKSVEGNYMVSHADIVLYKDGLLLGSSIGYMSADNTIKFDGHTVEKESGAYTMFVAYLEDLPCTAAPLVESPPAYCYGSSVAPLTAQGENIRWYSDNGLSKQLGAGNQFQPSVSATTRFYAT